MIFQYPATAHVRRHGPRGYKRPESFKPWLRDEFDFRCVYCLCRERWFPDGDASFAGDHLQATSRRPDLVLDYENLVYACCQCNSAKQDCDLILNPCVEAFGKHLHVAQDGRISPLSRAGALLMEICRLDRQTLTEFRGGMLDLYQKLPHTSGANMRELRRRIFGFPTNLPHLRALRPPNSNSKPDGISSSYYEKRDRGELAECY